MLVLMALSAAAAGRGGERGKQSDEEGPRLIVPKIPGASRLGLPEPSSPAARPAPRRRPATSPRDATPTTRWNSVSTPFEVTTHRSRPGDQAAVSPANERLVTPGGQPRSMSWTTWLKGKSAAQLSLLKIGVIPWKLGVSSVVLVSELPSQRSIRFPSTTTASEPSSPNFAYVMPPSAVKTGRSPTRTLFPTA